MKEAGKRRRDAQDDDGDALRRKVAAQELALQEACAAVMVKKEMIEEEAHASQRREGRLREVILRQLDSAEKVAEAVQDMMDAVDCPVCMERPANTALSCGHCFCCQDGCESQNFNTCAICRQEVAGRTALFGPVTSLH